MEVIENPPMPYWGKIPGGLQAGKMIHILGLVNHGADRFQIDFSRGDTKHDREIALHFNPRFDQRVVVRNSYVNRKWQEEEREPHSLPFQQGKDFDILFLVESNHFRIAVNGRHYANFKHRLPIQTIDKLCIEGYITVKKLEFTFHHFKPSAPIYQPQICPPASIYQPQICPPAPTYPYPQICPPAPAYPNPQICPPAPAYPKPLIYTKGSYLPQPSFPQPPYGLSSSSPVAQTKPSSQLQTKGPFIPPPPFFQPVYNPKMPFMYYFSEELPVGTLIYISGRCNVHANNFRVDFQCRIHNEKPPADIAFHINPRFEDKIVVRNSFISGAWGREERDGAFPFTAGAHFDLLINILQEKFMIAINGKHYAEYKYRIMPISRISSLSVSGDVIVSSCRFH